MDQSVSFISFPAGVLDTPGRIRLSGSKSQSNRLLLLQAAMDGAFSIDNLSDSDDTRAMRRVLEDPSSVLDVGHAGTAMRFGTAYLASCPGREVVLTGSGRMKERPIAPLVDALRSLGAGIDYLEREGCPPLRIRGRELPGGECRIDSTGSSQFITALMLMAPFWQQGLHLHLEGQSVSRPYIELTASVLRSVGLDCRVGEQDVIVPPAKGCAVDRVLVESDWSSASYFYALSAVARRGFELSSFLPESPQGDSRLSGIFREVFGVESVFSPGGILRLVPREGYSAPEYCQLDMGDTPDVAQSVAVVMAALKIKGCLTGLGTLRVKETDRIAALQTELAKFGVGCSATRDSLTIETFSPRSREICLETYQDHRMAMAFVPLALEGGFSVRCPQVVTKSYPRFWEDMASVGLLCREVR